MNCRLCDIFKWLDRFSALLAAQKSRRPAPASLIGDEAYDIILSSEFESLEVVGFDVREATHLGVQKNDFVLITPTDTGW